MKFFAGLKANIRWIRVRLVIAMALMKLGGTGGLRLLKHVGLEFRQPVFLSRQNSLWYCKDVVLLHYRGYRFYLTSNGYSQAWLCRKNSQEGSCFYKNRASYMNAGGPLSDYIKDDRELWKLLSRTHPRMELEREDNNGWEMSFADPDGRCGSYEYECYNSRILYAVAEVMLSMDEHIQDWEEEQREEAA